DLALLSHEVVQKIVDELSAGRNFTLNDLNSLLLSEKYALTDAADVMMELTNNNLVIDGDSISFIEPVVTKPLEEEVAEEFLQKFDNNTLVDISELHRLIDNKKNQKLNLEQILKLLRGVQCTLSKIQPEQEGGIKQEFVEEDEEKIPVQQLELKTGTFTISDTPEDSNAIRKGKPRLVLDEPLPSRAWRKKSQHVKTLETNNSMSIAAKENSVAETMPDFTGDESVILKYEKWEKFISEKKGSVGKKSHRKQFNMLIVASTIIVAALLIQLYSTFASRSHNFKVCKLHREIIVEALIRFQVIAKRKLNYSNRPIKKILFEKMNRPDLLYRFCPDGGEYTITKMEEERDLLSKVNQAQYLKPVLVCSEH
ncbi:hypothetical protein ACFL35_18820, partial [Candidatus Riflebacteria bacterium]